MVKRLQDIVPLNEIKNLTLHNYNVKASQDLYHQTHSVGVHNYLRQTDPKSKRAAQVQKILDTGIRKAKNRLSGIALSTYKLYKHTQPGYYENPPPAYEETEQLNELSPEMRGRYIIKAAQDIADKSQTSGAAYAQKELTGKYGKINNKQITPKSDANLTRQITNRGQGITNASLNLLRDTEQARKENLVKQWGITSYIGPPNKKIETIVRKNRRKVKEETEQLNEISKKVLTSYTKKATASQSDIDKKGWDAVHTLHTIDPGLPDDFNNYVSGITWSAAKKNIAKVPPNRIKNLAQIASDSWWQGLNRGRGIGQAEKRLDAIKTSEKKYKKPGYKVTTTEPGYSFRGGGPGRPNVYRPANATIKPSGKIRKEETNLREKVLQIIKKIIIEERKA